MAGASVEAFDFSKAAAPVLAIPGAAPQLLRAIGFALAGSVKARIQAGRSPDGTPFVPLARGRRRGGSRPLLDTGTLRNSISFAVSGGSVSVGTNLVYASVHQFGATLTRRARSKAARPGGVTPLPGSARTNPLPGSARTSLAPVAVVVSVPARPYLGVSAEDDALILRLIALVAKRQPLPGVS